MPVIIAAMLFDFELLIANVGCGGFVGIS